jgi:vitamin B12 transporter
LKSLIIFLIYLAIFINIINAQEHITIEGIVTGDNNKPLAYVNVYLAGTFDGTMTAEDGSFRFTTKKTGEADLVVSIVGYEQHTRTLNLEPRERYSFTIRLRSKAVETQTVVISASSFGSEEGKGLVVSPMDILMTPGGAADIFQTLKTLPGLTQVSESAELYVRGGNPTETITLLDGSSLYHPYTFESAYGGLFSNINTNIISGMYFSSGGFSVKYGNVLSGVLDMQTHNEPAHTAYNIGLNLAGGGVSAHVPVISTRLGIRVEARQSFTDPVMWLNGSQNEFTVMPRSRDIGALVSGRYSDTGRIKLYILAAQDKQGVNVRRAEYNGAFDGASNNYLINFHHTEAITSRLIAKTSLSAGRYTGSWKLGVLDLERIDDVYKFRTDAEYFYSSKWRLLFGTEIEHRTFSYLGRVPENEYNLRPDAPAAVIDVQYGGSRAGGYAELELPGLFGYPKLSAVAGLRFDYIDNLDLLWFDPRVTLGYAIGSNSTVRTSFGIFQQTPDPRLYDPALGNQDLKPMRAVHYIAAYDYAPSSNTNFRVELYHKEYDRLPLEHPELHYNNGGYGYARGVDVMAKGRPLPRLDGWISYGFVDTKRKWLDYEEYAPSSYDVTHNLTLIAMYRITDAFRTGVNFKYATGRPFTPVNGSVYREGYDVYEPVYGPRNSERYDNFRRLDLRFMYFRQLFGRYFTVFYFEAINVLDINNLFGYTHSRDYSKREEIQSYFGRRTVVFGVAVNL